MCVCVWNKFMWMYVHTIIPLQFPCNLLFFRKQICMILKHLYCRVPYFWPRFVLCYKVIPLIILRVKYVDFSSCRLCFLAIVLESFDPSLWLRLWIPQSLEITLKINYCTKNKTVWCNIAMLHHFTRIRKDTRCESWMVTIYVIFVADTPNLFGLIYIVSLF